MNSWLKKFLLLTMVFTSSISWGSGSNTVFLRFHYFFHLHDQMLDQMDTRTRSEMVKVQQSHGAKPSNHVRIIEVESYLYDLVEIQFKNYEKVRIVFGIAPRPQLDLTFIRIPETNLISAVDAEDQIYILKSRVVTPNEPDPCPDEEP